MKHDTSSERARRGYIIMAVLFLAAALIFNLDIIRDWVRGYVDVVAIVTETSGVRVGSPVEVEGMEAGRVTAMDVAELDGRGAVALGLRLADRARAVVTKESLASTKRRQFVGESVVLISGGPAGSMPIETGDTLYPARQVSLDTLLERGKAIVPALDSLTVALAELERLAGERRPDVQRVVNRLAVATEEAGILRSSLDGGTLDLWLRDPALGTRIALLRDRLDALSEAAGALQRYGDPELRRSVAAVSQRAGRLTTALEVLEQRLAIGDGVLGRTQRDSAIAMGIAGVQAQIDSLRAEGLSFGLRMIRP